MKGIALFHIIHFKKIVQAMNKCMKPLENWNIDHTYDKLVHIIWLSVSICGSLDELCFWFGHDIDEIAWIYIFGCHKNKYWTIWRNDVESVITFRFCSCEPKKYCSTVDIGLFRHLIILINWNRDCFEFDSGWNTWLLLFGMLNHKYQTDALEISISFVKDQSNLR